MLLKTDYQDDILDLTQNANRKFNEVQNQDGSKSFEDVTAYEQEGTPFGAQDVNAITKALTDEVHGVSFQFGIDGNGDYGYIKNGETEVTPFRNRHTETITPNSRATVDMGLYHKKRYVDLSAVPNVNSGTQTISNVYTSGNGLDLGATNSVRYIKTNNLMVIPTATKTITANGNNQDVLNYAKVNVNVNTAPSVMQTTPTTAKIEYLEDNYPLNVTGLTVGKTYFLMIAVKGGGYNSLTGCTILKDLSSSITLSGGSSTPTNYMRVYIVKATSTTITLTSQSWDKEIAYIKLD